MNSPFRGKVALVTGAGSGMGLATARAFAEAGAAVVLADVREHTVRDAAEELASAGRNAVGICCDVASEPDVAKMVAKTIAAFGRLDAAFNNAEVLLAHISRLHGTVELIRRSIGCLSNTRCLSNRLVEIRGFSRYRRQRRPRTMTTICRRPARSNKSQRSSP